jgi:hypothetical protein
MPLLSPDASHRCRGLWRMVAECRARAIHGTSEASPFASLASTYVLSDNALVVAINSHPLYAGWPEYDSKPDAETPA